jgi:hypothetical protein
MQNILSNYNRCLFCNSRNLKKKKIQSNPLNFYVKSIKLDLNLKDSLFKKMMVYECGECGLLQNNPWFNDFFSKKIYNEIYGQHNRNWSNIINFANKKRIPDHGDLYKILRKKIKIKNYAEFNSPFMGMFINFFNEEYQGTSKFFNNMFNYSIRYLSGRQVAGKNKSSQSFSITNSNKILKNIKKLKLKKKNNILKKKYLFTENSGLSWGQNDNYKSVNSRSLSSLMFDLDVLEIGKKNIQNKLDLFGIFHTLDHTFSPKKILNYALDNSKYVIVYCHIDQSLNKQHLFSFTEKILLYLKKKKVFNINLNQYINKKFRSKELYFLCSKNKKDIERLKLNS